MARFIAEISSNHSQSLERCLEFVETASSIGCDAVKFQLFKIEKLFAKEVLAVSPSHRERKKWELPIEFIPEIVKLCQIKGIEFACTPFYLEAVDFLEDFVDFYKIASYELLWDDLLEKCARTGKPVILSTGMATIEEIKHAVSTLKGANCVDVRLLHCTSSYPTPFEEANLAAIDTIRTETNTLVGWSDHTADKAVIYRAIHKWEASDIEFHLDLDGQGEEFNAGHCWLPSRIAEVINDVKRGFNADGNGVKKPMPSELPDRDWRADPHDGLRPLKGIRKSFKV